MADSDTRALVRRVLEHAAKLPPELRSDILARGAEAVAPLVELLRDESLADERAPGEGYAPVHAVELLARLKAPEGIAPMVRALMRHEPGEVLYDALLHALEEFGTAVVPAGLEALVGASTPEERFGLLSVLARAGVRDERIFTALLAQLQEDPTMGAMNLACYGDPGAIEPLKRALDAYPLAEDTEDLLANQAIIELQGAITELGGELDAAQWEKSERARRSLQWLGGLFQRMLEEPHPPSPPTAPRERRPGRNAPCWCGSGVKYKKCHLGSDPR
jgi:hypothetical protein